MKDPMIALFGEAEKGEFQIPYFCRSLPQLVDNLGNPPPDTHGLYYAIQALLFNYNLLFIRVREEGFSIADYMKGIETIETEPFLPHLLAVCTPGVGNHEIIDTLIPLCQIHHQILITNEADLYDFLTERAA